MAEERTEQPTPRRREEARRRGEVPRSAEVAAAAALLGALLGLRTCWLSLLEAARDSILGFFQASLSWQPSVPSASQALLLGLAQAAQMALPAAGGAIVAALAANLGQTGFLISASPLAFQWARLNPARGIQRIVSRQGAFSVGRSLLKLALVLAVAGWFLWGRWPDALCLAHTSALGAGAGMASLIWGLLLRVALALVVVALGDYVFQRREHERKLRMTRHELKEEYKRTEGDPLIRSRVRERRRAAARHRMIEGVKKATVVVTNPVEIAVALRYEIHKTPAPIVVAKGRRLLAERIKDQAERHGVPVTPSPDLARALYRSVPVGRQIPAELYQAVAEIIAFVYRMSGRSRG